MVSYLSTCLVVSAEAAVSWRVVDWETIFAQLSESSIFCFKARIGKFFKL